MKRMAGALMPISALPSKYGIGCFSREAYDFVDFLEKSGQSVWQILPLCPTSYGDSPYQSPSSFAINPYFISPERLIEIGLLRTEECERYSADTENGQIDYGELYKKRYPLLRIAFRRFSQEERPNDYYRFIEKSRYWLEPHALFMAIKSNFDGIPISEWDEAIKRRDPSSLLALKKKLECDIDFHLFLQYELWREWTSLKKYANERGIKILGDIPIYVSSDSVEVWSEPELFELTEDLIPLSVAGCPPDDFSPKGQLWGNPLYRWEYHKDTEFEWWRRRFSRANELYDMIRIDHFRGFESYYSIPYGSADATAGEWRKGIGKVLFDSLTNVIKKDTVIAEDLGYITDEVRTLVRECGFYSMKILEFGFEGNEGASSEHLPHYYTRSTAVYTGTHDNPPLLEWLRSLSESKCEALKRYLLEQGSTQERICERLVSTAMQSVSDICMIPIQDYINDPNGGRINVPSSESGNWTYRLSRDALNDDLARKIYSLCESSGRLQ